MYLPLAVCKCILIDWLSYNGDRRQNKNLVNCSQVSCMGDSVMVTVTQIYVRLPRPLQLSPQYLCNNFVKWQIDFTSSVMHLAPRFRIGHPGRLRIASHTKIHFQLSASIIRWGFVSTWAIIPPILISYLPFVSFSFFCWVSFLTSFCVFLQILTKLG